MPKTCEDTRNIMAATSQVMTTSNSMTPEEWGCSVRRLLRDCSSRMADGPAYALIGGSCAVWGIGLVEGIGCLKTNNNYTFQQKARFVVRYSLSQLIPSIVWGTQKPTTIAKDMKICPKQLYDCPMDAPPRRTLFLNRMIAFRGAIAGSVILSQVFALTDVLSNSRHAYSDRIRNGREPPLDDSTRHGVVIRLAGERSLVTNLTMARQGRRHLFPIFEDPTTPDVQNLIQVHASGLNQSIVEEVKTQEQKMAHIQKRMTQAAELRQKRNGSTDLRPVAMSVSASPLTALLERIQNWVSAFEGGGGGSSSGNGGTKTSIPRVPLYWQVNDGRYSHSSTWHGLFVPQTWLFDVQGSDEKLLLLEADATDGSREAMSLRRGNTDDFDLDLYEVAQGFTHLSTLVESKVPYSVVRILLVDPEAVFRSGGGRITTAREHTMELGLADIVVDARAPLVYAFSEWLKSCDAKHDAVILETPVQEWFESIQAELARIGYRVMDRAEALEEFGSLKGIPFFVYEKTTADTIHTIRQLVGLGMLESNQVCAFCPRHLALESLRQSQMPGVKYISSTDIYDRLLRWVRHRLLEGHDAYDIQNHLDHHLDAIMQCIQHNGEE